MLSTHTVWFIAQEQDTIQATHPHFKQKLESNLLETGATAEPLPARSHAARLPLSETDALLNR
jgi:hypothetical protein